ncbi:MAG: endo-1,4-beta-xylanase [Planctomycetaceae bacterium]|nr:endo-1,4-beta-xylanase [Planctomycetaceae bacterium]
MRFDLGSDDAWKTSARFEQAFFTSYDGSVFPTRAEKHGHLLDCIRQKSDSGKLNISWPVPGYGCPILRTCSLIEREQPYVLAVELARGQLGELKDQLASWEHAGMLIPDEFQAAYREAYQEFVRSTFEQQDPPLATEIASRALVKICEAENILARGYILQRLMVRQQRFSHPPALLGCELGQVPVSQIPADYPQQFGAAGINLEWKAIEAEEGTYHWDIYDDQVEWATQNKLVLRGGPLLSFDYQGLPSWLANWKADILNLQSFLSDYVETVITRYAGIIRIWEVVARVNTGGLFGFDEDNLLALTARMIDVARQVDTDSQIFIRIDRPWGDYQSSGKHRLTPWHVVDALLRSGMGLAGINLELSIGYAPGQNDDRRLLRFSRLLDTWGTFGVPLHVTIHAPSRSGEDQLALKPQQVEQSHCDGSATEDPQYAWVRENLSMLMAKQPVVGIFWGALSDQRPHRFPHSGLLDPEGHPKPSWNQFANYRTLDRWMETLGSQQPH